MKGNIDWSGWLKRLCVILSKYKYVLLVILAGIVLLLLPTLGDGEKKAAPAPASGVETPAAFDLGAMEEKLSEALSTIDGAGKVRVILTLKSSTRQVVARDDKTTDKENTSTTVVISKGSGTEDAIVLQEVYPQYQGALIICPGGDSAAVQLKLVGAVASVTGLGVSRISVYKGN